MTTCTGGTDLGPCPRPAVIAATAECDQGHIREGYLCTPHLVDVLTDASMEPVQCRNCAADDVESDLSDWTWFYDSSLLAVQA